MNTPRLTLEATLPFPFAVTYPLKNLSVTEVAGCRVSTLLSGHGFSVPLDCLFCLACTFQFFKNDCEHLNTEHEHIKKLSDFF